MFSRVCCCQGELLTDRPPRRSPTPCHMWAVPYTMPHVGSSLHHATCGQFPTSCHMWAVPYILPHVGGPLHHATCGRSPTPCHMWAVPYTMPHVGGPPHHATCGQSPTPCHMLKDSGGRLVSKPPTVPMTCRTSEDRDNYF